MLSREPIRLVLLVLLAACGSAALPVPEVPPTLPIAGDLRSGSLRVNYELVFDPNSLRQIAQVGDSVVALTRAGVLVRFGGSKDETAAIITPTVGCLGLDASGRLVAGLSDGTIGFVDVTKLTLDPVARLRRAPVWIGQTSSRLLVVVVDGEHGFEVHVLDVSAGEHPRLKSTWSIPRLDLPALPTSFLVDRADRLWFGIAAGEWGGAAGTVDLGTGRVDTVGFVDLPVRGFLEATSANDSRIWIYGGLAHLSRTYSFLVEVNGTKARPSMWRERSLAVSAEGPVAPANELLPVDRLAVAGDHEFWAVVAGELFIVDSSFQEWRAIGRLSSDRDGGTAVVEVSQLVPIGDGQLLVASLQDGWFRVHDDHIEVHRAREVHVPDVAVGSQSPLAIQDREGWTWRVGPGALSLVDDRGTVHDLSSVPGINANEVIGLHADPSQAHAVLIGIPGLVVRVSVVR